MITKTNLLLRTFSLVAMATASYSVPAIAGDITLMGDGPHLVSFTNDHDNGTASDFHITVTTPGVQIGGGNGGTQFPDDPILSPGGTTIDFDTINSGGPGVLEDGMLSVLFIGFDEGTEFNARWTFRDDDGNIDDGTAFPLEPIVQFMGDGPIPGEYITVNAVPEPLTILGAGTALGFGTLFKRKLNTSKKGKEKIS